MAGFRNVWNVLILRRNVVGIMAFLGFINVYSLRVNLSVAIVAMTQNRTIQLPDGNVTMGRYFDWSKQETGNVLSAFFYGYIFTQLPGGWLSSKLGGAKVFGVGILTTAILNLISPMVANVSLNWFIVLRIATGFFEGVTYPSIQAVWSRWAPIEERTRLTSLAYSGSFVGTVISFPIYGLIAENMGWAYTFYLPGIVGIMWCTLWFIFVRDNPSKDPFITKEELKFLQTNLGTYTQPKSIPWKAILTSMPVWSIVMAHFCENWGFYTLLTQLPSFMTERYGFDIKKAGFLSALPYFVMSVTLIVTGGIVDVLRRKEIFTTTQVRKLFNCTAFVSQTIFMVSASFAESAWLSTLCLTMAVGLGSFAWTAFSVNPLDIAPQYASIIMGVSNTFATISGILAPNVCGWLTADKNPNSWSYVFIVAACIYMCGAVFYGTFASGDRQRWAEIDEKSGVGEENKNTSDENSKYEQTS